MAKKHEEPKNRLEEGEKTILKNRTTQKYMFSMLFK